LDRPFEGLFGKIAGIGEIFLRRRLIATSPPLSAERENPQMIAAVARSARLLRQCDLVR
jgi:hypothetical protein